MKFTFIFLCLILAGCTTPTPEQIAGGDFGDRPTPEQSAQICGDWFKFNLKDYESARFEWGRLHKATFKNGPMRFGYVQEVMVNAKNSYGGYVGFKPYAIFIERGRAVTDVEPYMRNSSPIRLITFLD